MRTWLFAKIHRYFKKPVSSAKAFSMSKLQMVDDASAEGGYRLEWVGTASEGILFSLLGMGRMLLEYKTEIFSKGEITEVQKQNTSKLFADMLTGIVFAAAVNGLWKHALDDEDRANPFYRMLQSKLLAASSDTFLAKSLMEVVAGSNGSMFIAVGVVKNAFSRLLSTVWSTGIYVANGEEALETSDLLEAYARTAGGFYGPLNSAVQLHDIYNFYEEH